MTQNINDIISLEISMTDVCLGIYKYLKANANDVVDVKLSTGAKKGLICYNKAFKTEDFDLELSKILNKYKVEKYGDSSKDKKKSN
jgi:hypothetical protein